MQVKSSRLSRCKWLSTQTSWSFLATVHHHAGVSSLLVCDGLAYGIQVCHRIGELVAADEGLGPAVTASDVASALTIPLPIASEHLLTAETRGVLCRDDGPEGLRFFRNFFTDIATAA